VEFQIATGVLRAGSILKWFLAEISGIAREPNGEGDGS
jgi:hypothetical protein